jgi:hypothetical protein
MRWVHLRLGRACSDDGSMIFLERGLSLGLGLTGKLVISPCQIGQDRPNALQSATWC